MFYKMRLSLNGLNALFESKYFYIAMLPLAVIFVTIYSYSTSPFFVFEGVDSCVFKSMGLAILKGKTPYVDFFDHKGPVLYFINALGQWLIPGRLGIWSLQILADTVVFAFLYRISRYFLDGTKSVLILLVTLFIYGGVYQEGNQCEEWIFLAVAPALYVSLSVIIGQSSRLVQKYYGLLLGFFFGWAFFIRPNDAVSLIGGCMTGLVIYQLYNKQYRKVFLDSNYFILGFVLLSSPIIIFFASRSALGDLYYGLIQHNVLYANGILHLLLSCVDPIKMTFFLLPLAMCAMAYNTSYRKVLWVLLPLCLFTWITTGTNLFPHYLIGCIPLIMLFGVFLFFQRNIATIFLAICVLYYSSFTSKINYLYYAPQVFKNQIVSLIRPSKAYGIAQCAKFYKETDKLLDIVPKYEQDSIWNFNLIGDRDNAYFAIFWHKQLLQCNKVPYYRMNVVDKNLMEQERLDVHNPLWIVLSHAGDETYRGYYNWEKDYKYINEHYFLAARTDTTICNIELYRRK